MLRGSDMGKRKQSGIDLLATMPWPMGIAFGLLGYIAIAHGVGWYFGSINNPYLSGLGKLAATGIYAPLGWMLLVGCWIAAVVSFFGRRSRRKLLDKQTGIDSLRQMSWRQFEQLAGEAFRRQGYVVEETGLGGAVGGIDLILRKNGLVTLVQCKQWQNRQVGVKVVREMYGLLLHHLAAGVKIVALGNYTPDARDFAQGKAIELIHGGELIATVRSLQTGRTRTKRPMDSLVAFSGSMAASLLVIGALSPASMDSPTPAITTNFAIPPRVPTMSASIHHPTAPSPTRPQAIIYLSDSQNDAQLREWKKRNAESMKILEKTTKEMPLR
jgi:restriction system protein